MTTFSRRRLFSVAGGSAALAGAGAAGVAVGHAIASEPNSTLNDKEPFHGVHQAGIVTAVQDRLHFAALDVTTDKREELVDLLKRWTEASARMTAGLAATPEGAVGGNPEAPPADTGEALGLEPSRLTLTIGFGGSLFDDRFGLRSRRPDALADLPHFPADDLNPKRCGGDIGIQACANDPQVAVHAIRNLVRMGFGTVAVRWSQLGFGRTSSTSKEQTTPRNLFGFKDGTNNIHAEAEDDLHDHVWVQSGDDPEWMTGGSYLVTRRIRMHIETWDREPLAGQEGIIGRAKGAGAPLTGKHEFDDADFDATDAEGEPVIPADAHIRLASAQANDGVRILRRGYNFADGSDGLGHLDAGLFFMCYVRDAHKQFVPMQMALSSSDPMMEYIEHTGSALFACPPGVADGGHWGETLFNAAY